MASRTQQAPHSHRKNKQKQPSREKQRRLSLYEWEKKIEQHPNVSQRIAWLKQALEPHQKRLALPSPTNPNPRMHGRNASYEWTFRLLEKSCIQDPSPEVRCHAFSEMLRFCKDDRQVVRVLFSSMHQQSHPRSLRETYTHLSQELFVQSPLAKKMRCEALLQNHCLTGRPYSWRFSVYEFLPSPEEEQRAQEDYKALLSHYPAELVAQIIETGLENEKEHTFSLAARLLGAAFQEDLPGFDRSKVKRKIREATQVLNEPYPSRDADWRHQMNHRERYQKALRLLLWLPPAYTLPFVKTLHASLKQITTDANHARNRQEIQGLLRSCSASFDSPNNKIFCRSSYKDIWFIFQVI
ncbi:MAG: hypothetical protein H6728_10850 [Myxococcales bacterium]|nr:hypothetical protein [Myxococcales bacterium]